jgi:hypothetical protein
MASSDQTLGDMHLVGWTYAFGRLEKHADRGPMALFIWAPYISHMATF